MAFDATDGPYVPCCVHKHLTLAVVKFTGKATDPDVYTDGGGILDDDNTPIEHNATGTYILHLKKNYRGVYPVGVLMTGTTDDDGVYLEAVSDTADANSVTVRAQAGASADDQVGNVFYVTLALNLSDDA